MLKTSSSLVLLVPLLSHAPVFTKARLFSQGILQGASRMVSDSSIHAASVKSLICKVRRVLVAGTLTVLVFP